MRLMMKSVMRLMMITLMMIILMMITLMIRLMMMMNLPKVRKGMRAGEEGTRRSPSRRT